MLEGFYTAASGILTQERSLGVLTNNMVNAKTPGFRASRMVSSVFEQEYLSRIEQRGGGSIGKGAPIQVVSEVPVRFDVNSLEETGRPYDIAINGQGFFNVQRMAAGEDADPESGEICLTRNGNFDVDDEGYLYLRGQGRVLGENGQIKLPDADFTVDPNGEIYSADGKLIDTLLLTTPAEDAPLSQLKPGMYTVADMEANEPVEASVTLAQGWIERANIDPDREYTLVMEAQRAFQACSSALQIIDKLNQKASTQIASL